MQFREALSESGAHCLAAVRQFRKAPSPTRARLLDAVTEVELLEDVRDVCLDGRVADVELSADLGVREAAGDQAKTSSSRSVRWSSFFGGVGCGA